MTDPNRKMGNWAVREEYQSQNRSFVTVDTRLTNDECFRRLSEAGERVFFHLLTSAGTISIPGLILASEAQMSERLRWPVQKFRDAFAELVREGIAEADWEAGLVWLRKAFKHRWPAGPKVVQHWRKIILHALPECDLLRRALASIYEGLKTIYESPEGFVQAFENTVPIRYRIPYPIHVDPRSSFAPAGAPARNVPQAINDDDATAYPVDDRPDEWLREEEGVSQFREFPNAETPSPQGVSAVSLKPGDAIPEGFVAQGGTPSQTSAAGRGEVSATAHGNVFTLHPQAVPGRRERLWAKLQTQREERRGFKPEPIYRAIVHDRFTGEPVDTLAELMATYPDDEPIEQMHLGYLDTETITVGKGKHQTTTVLACANPGWPWSLFGRNADRYFKPKQAEAEDTSCVHCGGGASCKDWDEQWTCYACLNQNIADLAEAGDERAVSFLQRPHPWAGRRDEPEAVRA